MDSTRDYSPSGKTIQIYLRVEEYVIPFRTTYGFVCFYAFVYKFTYNFPDLRQFYIFAYNIFNLCCTFYVNRNNVI